MRKLLLPISAFFFFLAMLFSLCLDFPKRSSAQITSAPPPTVGVSGVPTAGHLTNWVDPSHIGDAGYCGTTEFNIGGSCSSPVAFGSVPNGTYYVTANFTTASSTSGQIITGLSWTMPANAVTVTGFSCHLVFSQATAAASDAFYIQDTTIGATNVTGSGNVNISAGPPSTFAAAGFVNQAGTGPYGFVTFTPGAIGTNYSADLEGFLEQPSNASSSTVNIMVSQVTAADLITVYRDSFCRVF